MALYYLVKETWKRLLLFGFGMFVGAFIFTLVSQLHALSPFTTILTDVVWVFVILGIVLVCAGILAWRVKSRSKKNPNLKEKGEEEH